MALWAFYGSRGQGPRVREPATKPVGKPDARHGRVRLDARGWETGRRCAAVPAPIRDATVAHALCVPRRHCWRRSLRFALVERFSSSAGLAVCSARWVQLAIDPDQCLASRAFVGRRVVTGLADRRATTAAVLPAQPKGVAKSGDAAHTSVCATA